MPDIESKARRVLALLENTPDGPVTDADTVLADLIQNADLEVTGIAAEAIRVWQESSDRESVEAMFKLLADASFEDWLDRSIEKTTRPGETDPGLHACPACGGTIAEDGFDVNRNEEDGYGEMTVSLECPHCGESLKARYDAQDGYAFLGFEID